MRKRADRSLSTERQPTGGAPLGCRDHSPEMMFPALEVRRYTVEQPK